MLLSLSATIHTLHILCEVSFVIASLTPFLKKRFLALLWPQKPARSTGSIKACQKSFLFACQPLFTCPPAH